MASLAECEGLRAWLRERLASYTDAAPESIRLDVRFRELGLQSEQVLRLVEELGRRVGRTLRGTVAWEHPTPDALAKHVVDSLSSPASESQSSAPAARAARTDEPIAVVGVACRFPGQVDGASELYRLLFERRSGVVEVPKSRFDLDEHYDPDPSAPGKLSTRWAGLLDDVAGFDAAFFGITPREARQMDPQQRLMLELAWSALEDAGLDPTAQRGAPAGVFIGAMWSDYARLLHRDLREIDLHTATGQDTSLISGRISYALGLSGPSLTVNTACSSSAMAVHLALQSLRSGESTLALAGGVHLIAAPDSTIALSKFGAMNPAGQCRAFDAAANGYVRGEGGGVVVLKPLARALADGDDIYCVIRGSASNNDGFSNGLTAPNPHAQQAVIRDALANAGVEASSIAYVETHGPGTILGDPLEAGALGAVFASTRDGGEPLRIGSIKTNIGHLEAAAGIAGLIKVAVLLRHRALLPNLHFERPNPHIAFESLRLRVQTAVESWPGPGTPRAGINSFGFGGTNCHIVCEAAPVSTAVMLPLAADSSAALRERALGAIGVLSRAASVRDMAALCAEIGERCGEGSQRAALVADQPRALLGELTELLSGRTESRIAPDSRPRLVFLCPGQGGYWAGMLRSLLGAEPAFREPLEACDREVRAQYGWSVIEELVASEADSRMGSAEVAQLVQLSVQIALGKLWIAWGFTPDAIIGHSLGEVAACCLADILSLPDAVRIAGQRARSMAGSAEAQGGMLLVSAEHAGQIASAVELARPLELAAHNSPRSQVFAGAAEDIAQARARLEAAGMTARPVPNITLAGHCSRMDSVRSQLCDALRDVAPRRAQLQVRSTSRDGWLEGPECGAAYWADNVRNTVRFREAVEALSQDGPSVFVELGAHPVLLKSVAQTLEGSGIEHWTLASCQRGEDERRNLLDSAAELFRLGFSVRAGALRTADEAPDAQSLVELERYFGPAHVPEAGPVLPFLASGKSVAARAAQLSALREHVSARPASRLPALASSLATARAQLDSRAVVIARDRRELLEAPQQAMVLGEVTDAQPLAFLFSGQASQRAGMGAVLARELPLFRQAFESVRQAFARSAAVDLREAIAADQQGETAWAQPALFALQVALYRCFDALGVSPSTLLGHSSGELAAAHVAGVLSLDAACTLVAARGRLMGALPRGGAMLALSAGEAEVAAWLKPYAGRVSLAVINGPGAVVVSGDSDAIDAIALLAGEQRREATRLCVSHAFHSSHMDPMLAPYRAVLSQLRLEPARVPIVSSVTGRLEAPESFADPEYWVRQVREPVRFAQAVAALHQSGTRRGLELGPGAVLTHLACSQFDDFTAWPSLDAGARETETLLRALAELHVRGHAVAWPRWFAAVGGGRTRAPGYAFQRERFWLEAAPRPQPVLDGVRYGVEWRPVAARTAGALSGVYWILPASGDAPLAGKLGAALAARGACVRQLEPGEAGFELPRTERPNGILLFATDGSPLDEVDPVPRGLAQLMAALNAWRECDYPGPLWVLTRGAARVADDDAAPRPEQAMIAALARVASLEHPAVWGGTIDLGAGRGENIDALVAALAAGEDELALRGTALYARRLVRLRAPLTSAAPARATFGGTALITGGTGVLGARVARFLAARGTEHVVLVSRRAGAGAEVQALREDLERAGARVTFAALDVADRAALARLVAGLREGGERITTLVHAAGVNSYVPIAELGSEQLAATLRAKVLGARNLDALLSDEPQHFVLFASGAGVWGSARQGAYAAANAYLDALAQQRAARGQAATSIAWGLWDGGGMASGSIEAMRRRGVLALDPERALAALEQALCERVSTLTVAEFDWHAFAPIYAAERARPLIAELAPSATAAAPGDGARPAEFLERLRNTDRANRDRFLLRSVCDAMAVVLGVDARSVQPNRSFKDVGMDSLLSLQLRRRLSEVTGRALPATLLFNHPTPASVAAYLKRELTPDSLASVLEELERLEPQVLALEAAGQQHVARRFEALLEKCRPLGVPGHLPLMAADDSAELDSLDDEQLLRLVDESLGQQGLGNGNG